MQLKIHNENQKSPAKVFVHSSLIEKDTEVATYFGGIVNAL